MNCREIREQLALSISGDAHVRNISTLDQHLNTCAACREYREGLENSRALLLSLRSTVPTATALARMRAGVLSRIEDSTAVLGWRVRFERFVLAGFRRPRFAVATAIAAGVFSAALFSQIRWVAADTSPAAVLDGDTLSIPQQYREWVFVGSSTRVEDAVDPATFQNVYISPEAYKEYKRSGAFPEGAVMVMESALAGSKDTEDAAGHYGKDLLSVKVSVKDSRFKEGWGYFEFKGQDKKARALPESAGCLACHRNRGATDHVFTQFYPVLRVAAAVL